MFYFYKRQFFDTKAEMQWAVFFDLCGIEWKYYDYSYRNKKEKKSYLAPCFILEDVGIDGVYGNIPELILTVEFEDVDVYAKGYMSACNKINYDRFFVMNSFIPRGNSLDEIKDTLSMCSRDISAYSMFYIDGKSDKYIIAVTHKGTPCLISADIETPKCIDEDKTVNAYNIAKNVRCDEEKMLCPNIEETQKVKYFNEDFIDDTDDDEINSKITEADIQYEGELIQKTEVDGIEYIRFGDTNEDTGMTEWSKWFKYDA